MDLGELLPSSMLSSKYGHFSSLLAPNKTKMATLLRACPASTSCHTTFNISSPMQLQARPWSPLGPLGVADQAHSQPVFLVAKVFVTNVQNKLMILDIFPLHSTRWHRHRRRHGQRHGGHAVITPVHGEREYHQQGRLHFSSYLHKITLLLASSV